MNKTIEKVIYNVYGGNKELKKSLAEKGFMNIIAENGIWISAEKENKKYLFFTAYTSKKVHAAEMVIWKVTEDSKTIYKSPYSDGVEIKKNILDRGVE
ncbi:hypothetical protein [Muricomes intestini]|uniref:hypothetical protein n=1 Tax=Muricomes intestini TaxID=1796634 RepID=UPI002FDC96CB